MFVGMALATDCYKVPFVECRPRDRLEQANDVEYEPIAVVEICPDLFIVEA